MQLTLWRKQASFSRAYLCGDVNGIRRRAQAGQWRGFCASMNMRATTRCVGSGRRAELAMRQTNRSGQHKTVNTETYEGYFSSMG